MRYKNWVFGVLLFLIGVFVINRFYVEKKENEMLKDYKEVTAILTRVKKGSTRSPASGYFRYTVNGQEFEHSQSGAYYKYLNIGDTVLIKYAIQYPSVARVENSRYMKRLRASKE